MALLVFNWSKVSKTSASKMNQTLSTLTTFLFLANFDVLGLHIGIYRCNVFCNLFLHIIVTVDIILPEKVRETQNVYTENENLIKLSVIN